MKLKPPFKMRDVQHPPPVDKITFTDPLLIQAASDFVKQHPELKPKRKRKPKAKVKR